MVRTGGVTVMLAGCRTRGSIGRPAALPTGLAGDASPCAVVPRSCCGKSIGSLGS